MAKQVSISLGRTGGVLKDGVYKARITQIEVKEGSAAPYFACRLKIEGHATTVLDNVSTAEGARFRLEPWLDAIEAPKKGNMTANQVIKLARNKLVYVQLTNEEYNGALKNKVGAYLTAEVGERLMSEMEPDLEEEDGDDEDADFVDGEDGEDGEDDFDEDDDEADEEGGRDGLPF